MRGMGGDRYFSPLQSLLTGGEGMGEIVILANYTVHFNIEHENLE